MPRAKRGFKARRRRNRVFQWAQGELNFQDIRDKIMTLAMNRASLAKPMPMEVDRVKADYYYPEEAEWHEEVEECWDESGAVVEIGCVGEACRRCGGLGHYARECPTPKGKGKGKSKGDVKGKGKGKDAGKGKGKGKGKAGWGLDADDDPRVEVQNEQQNTEEAIYHVSKYSDNRKNIYEPQQQELR